jgi:hypothetical protein
MTQTSYDEIADWYNGLLAYSSMLSNAVIRVAN